jgi:hypothetical protein
MLEPLQPQVAEFPSRFRGTAIRSRFRDSTPLE